MVLGFNILILGNSFKVDIYDVTLQSQWVHYLCPTWTLIQKLNVASSSDLVVQADCSLCLGFLYRVEYACQCQVNHTIRKKAIWGKILHIFLSVPPAPDHSSTLSGYQEFSLRIFTVALQKENETEELYPLWRFMKSSGEGDSVLHHLLTSLPPMRQWNDSPIQNYNYG